MLALGAGFEEARYWWEVEKGMKTWVDSEQIGEGDT